MTPTSRAKEKIGHMFRLEGKKQEAIKEARAGEIVAAAKLKDVSTGDTFCDEKSADSVRAAGAFFAGHFVRPRAEEQSR